MTRCQIICINFQVTFFVDNFQEFATFNTVYEEIFKLHIFYWIKAEVFLKRNSFIREDAVFCFAIYLVSYSSSQWCHATRFSLAVRDSFLTELAIAKSVKYILTNSGINLAKLSSMQIFLWTWQEHLFINNPAQFASNIIQWYFCFLHPTRKPTNLEVRYVIQITESLIFTNLEIDIFCVVQETSHMV